LALRSLVACRRKAGVGRILDVCVFAELARSWIQMTMGEGKSTWRTSILGSFAAAGLAEVFHAKGMMIDKRCM
jgi:hypothetical protein